MLITGLHHVTAFAKQPAANHRFYTESLGLRLVKRTVNFDDPFTYHLYFGDEVGSPGSLLTTFPNPRSARARHGTEEIAEIVLATAPGGLSRWESALRGRGTEVSATTRHGRPAIAFADPDGMRLAMVEDDGARSTSPAARGDQGAPLAIERPVLRVVQAAPTIAFLTTSLGFEVVGDEAGTFDLRLGPGGIGQRLTVIEDRTSPREAMGAGTVHHVAWRVPDEAAQRRAIAAIQGAGVAVTPIIDRQYFRSIYFRIPGNLVFEIATDGPGFDVDEPRASLGTSLRLPPQHEPRRQAIMAQLVPLADGRTG